MKIGRKLVSVLLCAVMLLSIMPVISFSADTVVDEVLVLDELMPVTLPDYESSYVMSYTAQSSGYYRLTSHSYFIDTDPYVCCFDENGNDLGSADDEGVGYDFGVNLYFEKGATYYFEFGVYDGYDQFFDVCLRKLGDGVTSLKVGEIGLIDLEEGEVGEFFKFVPEESGYYAFYSLQGYDPFGYVYDSEWILLNKDDDSAEEFNFYVDFYFEAGETYYFEASTYNCYEPQDYEVSLMRAEYIEEINIESYPDDMTYYEDFPMETIDLTGLVAEIVYSDGSVDYWYYDDMNDVFGMNVFVDCLYDENNKIFVKLWSTFAYTDFYLEPVENPVESISYHSGSDITLTEGYDCYYDEDLEMNIYWYEIPEDTMIEVNYKDGTSEIVSFYADEVANGYFDWYDAQMWGVPWTVGTNSVYITLFDAECEIPVEVIKNPVKSCTLNTAPTTEYAFGDPRYGYVEDGLYTLFPVDLDGISFTVEYTDGTKTTFTDADIDETNCIDGYYVGVYPLEITSHGVYEVTAYYLGHEFSYEITVTDELPVIFGDTDLDGEMSILDATEIQLVMALLKDWRSEYAMLAADVDGDGEISVMDATEIQLILAGLI